MGCVSEMLNAKPPSPIHRLVHFGATKIMEKQLNAVAHVDQVSLDYFTGYRPKSAYSDMMLKGDISNISLPDNFADGIITFHVLEHVPVVKRAYNELHRVLRPDGWLLVEVPCRYPSSAVPNPARDCRGLVNDAARMECAGQIDHVWVFECNAFKHDLEEAGFVCEFVHDILALHLSPAIIKSIRLFSSKLQLKCTPVN
jgi:SAM-dependent methyltransferase